MPRLSSQARSKARRPEPSPPMRVPSMSKRKTSATPAPAPDRAAARSGAAARLRRRRRCARDSARRAAARRPASQCSARPGARAWPRRGAGVEPRRSRMTKIGRSWRRRSRRRAVGARPQAGGVAALERERRTRGGDSPTTCRSGDEPAAARQQSWTGTTAVGGECMRTVSCRRCPTTIACGAPRRRRRGHDVLEGFARHRPHGAAHQRLGDAEEASPPATSGRAPADQPGDPKRSRPQPRSRSAPVDEGASSTV